MKKTRLNFILFITFLKVSSFTFTGGLAIIAAIERDLVDKHHLVTREEFMEYATLSQTLPGVIALNFACFVGRHCNGFIGMLLAGLGAILPAFVFMIIATILATLIPQQGPFLGAMRGVRAASAALVLATAFQLGRHNLKNAFSIIVMIAAFFLLVWGNIGAPLIVLAAGISGYVFQTLKRRLDRRNNHV